MTPSGQSDSLVLELVSEGPRASEDLAGGPMRFAYADPPYPGQAKRLYGDHPDYGGEVDYGELIERLMSEYSDGWALSCGSRDLQDVLPLCPRPRLHKGGRQKSGTGVRVMAWCKPMCPTYPVAVQWAWEPVIVHAGRARADRAPGYVRDFLAASPPAWNSGRSSTHIIGTKPREFCYWLFQVLGARAGDRLDDLYPGSGMVGEAWADFTAQGRLLA